MISIQHIEIFFILLVLYQSYSKSNNIDDDNYFLSYELIKLQAAS